jgi:hypothetical protein
MRPDAGAKKDDSEISDVRYGVSYEAMAFCLLHRYYSIFQSALM